LIDSYIKIPDYVLEKKISPRAKILYAKLILLCHKNGFCFANNKYLADILNVSTRTISKLLTALKNEKLIRIMYDESRNRNIYIEKNF